VNTDLIKESGTITQGDVLIGKALQHVTGTFQAEGDSQVVNLTVNAPNMPVDDMEAMLPAFGVILPSGSRLAGGTLSAELAITGPVDKAVVTGPIRLSNTKLANFDLGAKLGALQAFTGKVGGSSDTTIQNFSTNARASALEGVKADAINLTIPALGVITGAGTVSPAGELNFRMLANLHGGVAGGLSTVALGNSSKGIAFSIQGTASNPKFIPDVGSVATGVATSAIQGALSGKAPGGVSSGVGALGGLLGGKKKGQ
jgi:AsmA protein